MAFWRRGRGRKRDGPKIQVAKDWTRLAKRKPSPDVNVLVELEEGEDLVARIVHWDAQQRIFLERYGGGQFSRKQVLRWMSLPADVA